MARLLGIDFGEKRVGLALSDEGARLAFPHTTLQNNRDLVDEVLTLINEYEVEKVVIGDSKDFNMRENKIMEKARDFADDLKNEKKRYRNSFSCRVYDHYAGRENTFSIIRKT
jgi:putative Holliday junction resolvase